MTTYQIAFAGLHLSLVEGWQDVTNDLSEGSPPTLARADGVGVMQVSCGAYTGGAPPNVAAEDLKEMLFDFARRHSFATPQQVREVKAAEVVVSADLSKEGEVVVVWYATNYWSVALVTYTAISERTQAVSEEIEAVERMVCSIRLAPATSRP
jgi:hypothetical protein